MEVREHLAALEVRGASSYVLHAEKGRRITGYEPKNFVLRDTGQDFGDIVDETSSSENRFATLTLAGGNPIARQMSVTARVNAKQLDLNSMSNEILVP